jgi:hypothetical protein
LHLGNGISRFVERQLDFQGLTALSELAQVFSEPLKVRVQTRTELACLIPINAARGLLAGAKQGWWNFHWKPSCVKFTLSGF